MSSYQKSTPLHRVYVSFVLLGFLVAVNSYGAVVATVDWDNSDSNPDGVIAGTLGGVGVTLTTGTNGVLFPENGGVFLGTGTDWAFNLGSDNVPGISNPGIFNEGAVIDMGTAASGRTEVSFSKPVTNPTILINFIHDGFVEFNFDPLMPALILVDSASLPGRGTVPSGIGPANNVFTNASVGDNSEDSGFAVQLTGTFNQIGFDTSPGVNALDIQTVGFTLLATIPEPASAALLAVALVAMIGLRRRPS